MKETEALLRVQEIDLALMRHRKTLAGMPQTKKIQAIKAARKKLASEITRIVGLRKDAIMDLEDNEKGHDRLEEIVLETQERFEGGSASYREIADLESQLTSLAKRIEKYEFKHKELEARLKKIQAAEADAREMDARLVAEAEAQAKSYKEQTANIQLEARQLTAEREQVMQDISPEVAERYAQSCKRFGGLAVERLVGNRPSVCNVTIPPSNFGDIRRGAAITECPYCHRMLVTEGMYDAR